MKTFQVLAAVTLLLTTTTSAEDLTLPNGKKFTNYRVTRVEPNGLTLTHSDGITKVFFWELPKELQTRYGYDPATAAAYHQQSRAQQAEVMRRQQETTRLDSVQRQYDNARYQMIETVKKSGGSMTGRILQVTRAGILLSDAHFVTYYRAEVETPGRKIMEAQKTYETRSTLSPAGPPGEPVFIIGVGSGLVDGTRWSGMAYPAGTYSYGTVIGSGKTVKCFAPTPESAVERQLTTQ